MQLAQHFLDVPSIARVCTTSLHDYKRGLGQCCSSHLGCAVLQEHGASNLRRNACCPWHLLRARKRYGCHAFCKLSTEISLAQGCQNELQSRCAYRLVHPHAELQSDEMESCVKTPRARTPHAQSQIKSSKKGSNKDSSLFWRCSLLSVSEISWMSRA